MLRRQPSILLGLLLILLVVACTPEMIKDESAQPDDNPVIELTGEESGCPWMSGVKVDGTYYLYATGEVNGDNGYRVYTSQDLVNWDRGPIVFQPGERHIWAPDVWRDPDSGRFYLYYTANRTIGVVDAPGPLARAIEGFLRDTL